MSVQPDAKLERLYDYTKFHIGVYLLAFGAMVTVISSDQLTDLVSGMMRNKTAFYAAMAMMAVAGLTGGTIAATCASADKFDDVWAKSIGPWDLPLLEGRYWARIEHLAFWASVALLVYAATH